MLLDGCLTAISVLIYQKVPTMSGKIIIYFKIEMGGACSTDGGEEEGV
jgi:hypothetical protein